MVTFAIFGGEFVGPGFRGYLGPGDLVPGFTTWAGLRAYSGATCSTKAVNLRRDSDQASQDFNTLSTGNLDVAGIANFKGGANLFVTTVYDQTGNGNHFAQATAANQPGLTLAGLGGSLPIMTFSGSQCLFVPNFTLATPVTISTVALVSDTAIAIRLILFGDTNSNGTAFINNGTAACTVIAAVTAVRLPTTINTWYAIASVSTTASGNMIDVNGTSKSNPTNGGGYAAENLIWGAADTAAATQPLIGNSNEIGILPSAASVSALINNQRAYWGI